MPFFVRGDDAEFGLRTEGRKFMTMNGICVWHMSFGKSKFNAFNECYLAIRNVLIISAITRSCAGVAAYDNIFLHDIETELRKFNYDYADMMCDAVEDYLRGPAWLSDADPEALLKEKSAKKPKQVTFDTLPPSVSKIYACTPLPFKEKFKMKFTHNGQVHCSDKCMTDVPGIMINEFRLYHDSRTYMHKELWFVNDDLCTGHKTYIDRDRYKQIRARLKQIKKDYKNNHKQVEESWREAHKYLTSEEFWINFLQLDPKDYE
jgi:hypothetical protein